jgi:hypothetical protein
MLYSDRLEAIGYFGPFFHPKEPFDFLTMQFSRAMRIVQQAKNQNPE